ncbi:MAG: hypothetical protein RLZZ135_2106 [Cyanobacteriota bacterium]
MTLKSSKKSITTQSHRSTITRKCPKCADVANRSRRKSKTDRILALFSLYPYRCHQSTCQYRFYRFGED